MKLTGPEIVRLMRQTPTRKERKRLYGKFLASDHWKKKRLKILERAGGWCEWCNLVPPYSVHHITYRRLGRERLSDLIAVCKSCHGMEHSRGKMIRLPLWKSYQKKRSLYESTLKNLPKTERRYRLIDYQKREVQKLRNELLYQRELRRGKKKG